MECGRTSATNQLPLTVNKRHCGDLISTHKINGIYVIPHTNITVSVDRSLSAAGPRVWNVLPSYP